MAKQELKPEKKSGDKKSLQTTEEKPIVPTPFDEMERFFDDFLTRRFLAPFRWGFPTGREFSLFETRMPKVDVIDRDKEITVRAELPGVAKDDLEVSMTEKTLTIRATAKRESKEEKGEYYRREMSRGEFQRTLSLPAEVDAEKIVASFKDGVLELTLPKIEASKRRIIKVD